jgi:hypothetical protein
MATADFLWRRDFTHIRWKDTLWLNFLRALFAGPVWTAVMVLTGEPLAVAVVYLLFPLLYFGGGLPLGLTTALLSSLGVPYVGLFTILCSLLVVVGDPFVFILYKVKPNIIPVQKFSVLNFVLIIFVLDDIVTSNGSQQSLASP